MPKGKTPAGGTDGGFYRFDAELFRRRVEDQLGERGWGQTELAKAAGINQGTVSKYLNGEREPKATAVLSIALSLGVTPDQLLGPETVRRKHERSMTPVPDSNTRPSQRAAKR